MGRKAASAAPWTPWQTFLRCATATRRTRSTPSSGTVIRAQMTSLFIAVSANAGRTGRSSSTPALVTDCSTTRYVGLLQAGGGTERGPKVT